MVGPSRVSTGYLSPGPSRSRVSRSASFVSDASSSKSYSMSDVSRSASPSAGELSRWGRRNEDGTWSCAHPGCTSRSTFGRGCDLRKHYKRHTKSWFCSYQDCPQAHEGGFSSKKDKARHEAKHDPQIVSPCFYWSAENGKPFMLRLYFALAVQECQRTTLSTSLSLRRKADKTI